ncbi:MAG: hypothetical protein LUE31_06725, partial [Lachnospiraceae bacterium]|nr:hypothetical protein [Lachnospiraceae bacterium]
ARAAAATAAAATAAWNSRKANADATAARRREILQRLTEIRHRINSRNRICEEELGAVADRLTAKFAAYASGVLLKPFSADVLPQLDWRPHLEDYYHDHAPLMGRISEALDETEVSHACA